MLSCFLIHLGRRFDLPTAPLNHKLYLSIAGNLHPLLNGESLKNWPNGEFEKRMSQIWSIFKHMFGNWSIFRQMLENTVHFQTCFENESYFQTSVWKLTYFQTYVWKLTIFGSSYFQTRHWASFSNFHHLVGDASYHWLRHVFVLLLYLSSM